MFTPVRQRIRRDLDLIDRFVATYSRHFAQLADELNANPAHPAAGRTLRLCVETLHMMLSNQQQLAEALRELMREKPGLAATARAA